MKILQVVPFEESVPPKKYGGIELVAYNLIEELVRRNHQVYLIASGDSNTSAELIPYGKKALRHLYKGEELQNAREIYKFLYPLFVAEQINRIKPDVIHNHYAWRILATSKLYDAPIISTMHGQMDSYNEQVVYKKFSDQPLISISNNQREAMPNLNWIKTIYNGIDPLLYHVGKKSDRKYFAFLGRTSPEKGLSEICQMIKSTNNRLKIAAKIDPVDQEYFDKKVLPYIDGKQIEFLGEIGPEQKAKFLARAKALLLWLNWEEPFGLVVTEAMASGTPVIVNRRGSMQELVRHGKNGFLVDKIAEMREFLSQTDKISSQACHEIVEENFSTNAMTNQYEQILDQYAHEYRAKKSKPTLSYRHRRYLVHDSARMYSVGAR